MFRNILTILMVALLPFRAISAQEEVVATYPVTGYALGAYNARVTAQEIATVAGDKHKVLVVGYADANPWRSCGSKQCSDHKNQLLAELRASEAAKALETAGIDTARINTRGEVRAARGGEHRGVVIYIIRETAPVVAPTPKNDSLATVARKVDTLQIAVKAINQEVAQVRDTVTQVAAVVQQIINNTNASDTGKKEQKHESWVDLAVGLGYNSGYAGGMKESSLNFGGGLFIKPRVLPFELLARGGYAPRGSNKEWKCGQSDATLSLGAHRLVYEAETFMVGASVGGFTDRRYCTNGGVRLAEQWTEKVDGLYAGPTFQVPMFGSLHMWATAEMTYGRVTTAENLYKPKNAFGIRTGAMLRWAPNKNNNKREER